MTTQNYRDMHDSRFLADMHDIVNDIQKRAIVITATDDAETRAKSDVLLAALRIDYALYLFEDEWKDHNYNFYTMHERVFKLDAVFKAALVTVSHYHEILDPYDYNYLMDCIDNLRKAIQEHV